MNMIFGTMTIALLATTALADDVQLGFRHQMMELKDEADIPVAKPNERGIVERTQIRVCNDDLSRVCAIQSAEGECVSTRRPSRPTR